MTSPSSDDDPAPKGRAVVRLKPKAEARAIRHGFPWVYADELVTDRRTSNLTPGALAVLEDGERQVMGLVTVNVKSKIIARMLDRDPEALAAQLVAAFGLEDAPDMAAALALAKAPNGGPTDFVAGTWRQYAEPMKALFVPLGEMAVRLGYPAE